MSLSPDQIITRLESIEADLGARQQPFEKAAEDFHLLTRDVEHKRALLYAGTKGSPNERKEQATSLLWQSEPELMNDLKVAEASFQALKAVVGVLDKRAIIGMALLKSHGRDVRFAPDGPTFGRRAA